MSRATLLAALLAVSCAPTPVPPDPLERDLTGIGDPEPHDTPVWVPDAGPPPEAPDAGLCCVVRFAVAAGPDDLAGVLIGSRAPLLEPLPLTRDGGAWEVDVCMPLETQAYYFERYLPADGEDAGVFPLPVVNANSPTDADPLFGSINVFEGASASTCDALDAGVYGDVTTP